MSIHPAEKFAQWDLSDRLSKALKVSGLKVQDMAEYLGVSRGSVGNWINGRVVPSTQTIRLWALRTGAPYEWLKDGTPITGGDGGPGESFLGESNSRPFHYKRNVMQFPGEISAELGYGADLEQQAA